MLRSGLSTILWVLWGVLVFISFPILAFYARSGLIARSEQQGAQSDKHAVELLLFFIALIIPAYIWCKAFDWRIREVLSVLTSEPNG
jgi:hypothetical protein